MKHKYKPANLKFLRAVLADEHSEARPTCTNVIIVANSEESSGEMRTQCGASSCPTVHLVQLQGVVYVSSHPFNSPRARPPGPIAFLQKETWAPLLLLQRSFHFQSA